MKIEQRSARFRAPSWMRKWRRSGTCVHAGRRDRRLEADQAAAFELGAPPSAAIWPLSRLKQVVLPAPLGPISASNCPGKAEARRRVRLALRRRLQFDDAQNSRPERISGTRIMPAGGPPHRPLCTRRGVPAPRLMPLPFSFRPARASQRSRMKRRCPAGTMSTRNRMMPLALRARIRSGARSCPAAR